MARRSALVAVMLAAALTAGCGRPTGDFGRAAPSVLHDRWMPAFGAHQAAQRGEAVSAFNLTDTERLLRDVAWGFVRPPHVGDWWMEDQVEGQRTRILPELDHAFDPKAYYAYLRAGDYRSSEARWTKVIADIQGDALMVPPFCEVAARVRNVDAERLATVERQASADAAFARDAVARVAENDAVMAWVWRALDYRLTAYRFALDRLEVETPSDQLFEANRTFSILAAARCEGATARRLLPGPPPPSSRIAGGPDPFDRPVLQK